MSLAVVGAILVGAVIALVRKRRKEATEKEALRENLKGTWM